MPVDDDRPTRPRCRLVVLALAVAACGDGGERQVDLMPLIEGGAFLPATAVVELKTAARAALAGDERYDLPSPLVPLTGWGRSSWYGWRPLGARSTLVAHLPATAGEELVLHFARRPATGGGPRGAPIALAVRAGGVMLGGATLQPAGPTTVRLPLPASAGRALAIELDFTPPIAQPETGRPAIALERLGILPPAAPLPPPRPPPEPALDPKAKLLELPGPGRFALSVRLPQDVSELRFAARARGGERPLRLHARDGLGTAQRLELACDRPAADGFRPCRAPLDRLAGSDVLLVFDASSIRRLALRAPRLVMTGDGTPAVPSHPRSPPAEPLPDVLLIILDAARPDHFGVYGYPRPTTPQIDRLARRALVFRRAFAECPSTSCSIPHLITGRALLPAGTAERPARLADEEVTLAEELAALGYRTVALSANPYHSVSRNLHQGFAVFERRWGQGVEHGPYAMSRRAAQLIAEQPAGRPLFLQLHYLPPHEPYAPAAPHDLFRLPGYRGPIVPGAPLGPYRRRPEALSADDRAELVGLYDGNLRTADDAVGEVVAALRAAGRFDDSIILITADHGEAFFEHGEQGHNSTLYDEMLRVPFILRLPGGRRPPGVDEERPASLGDVLPTVLGLLGRPPPAAAGGIDLLAAPPDPRRPRILVHRTLHGPTSWWAARGPRLKAIVRPRLAVQQLFDLEADPGERRNLLGERPLDFLHLALHLRRQRRLAEAGEAPGIELSDEERAALRALGYLD